MANGYQSGGAHQGGQQGGYRLTDYDRSSADVPIWNWLSGAGARADRLGAANESDANRAYWDALRAPTADQLMGPAEDRDAQTQALRQMQQWAPGTLTGADRRMLESTRGRDSQASGAAQRSISQQAQARGVGGSGLDYGAQLAASQQGQQQASDAESQAMQSAQQRGMQATQQMGQQAGALREQDVNATQQAYEDAAQRAAGATGQYSTDVGSRNARAQRDQQRDQGIISALGALIA